MLRVSLRSLSDLSLIAMANFTKKRTTSSLPIKRMVELTTYLIFQSYFQPSYPEPLSSVCRRLWYVCSILTVFNEIQQPEIAALPNAEAF